VRPLSLGSALKNVQLSCDNPCRSRSLKIQARAAKLISAASQDATTSNRSQP